MYLASSQLKLKNITGHSIIALMKDLVQGMNDTNSWLHNYVN